MHSRVAYSPMRPRIVKISVVVYPTVSEIIDSAYLCQNCDYIGEIETGSSPSEMKCPACGEKSCVFAIHMNRMERRKWVEIEKSGKFKRDKKLQKSFRHDVVSSSKYSDGTSELDYQAAVEIVDNIYEIGHSVIDEINRMDPDTEFPRYRINWNRENPNSRRKRLERSSERKKTHEGTLRGELYEGLFRKAMDSLDKCKRNLESLKNERGNSCTPDGWITLSGGVAVPVEFKTLGKEKMNHGRGIAKHLKQSRKQGDIANDVLKTKYWWSLLIVICPERRSYAVFLMDEDMDSRIKHLLS